MAVETVLLALLGVVALWLAFDAGRERHRLRARMQRSACRRATRGATVVPVADGPVLSAATSGPAVPLPDAWRYWPLTLPATDDGSIGPRF